MAADFSEAAIYVGTYAKYNAGSLFGKWFNLSDFADKDEFMEACKELHKDEEDPEFMFQDRETYPKNSLAKVGFQRYSSSYGTKWKIWTQPYKKPFPLGWITKAGI